MFTIEAEPHAVGRIQHFTTPHRELALCLYEAALNAGMEPEFTILPDRKYLVEMVAEDDEFDAILPLAWDAADATSIRALEQSA